MVEKNRVRRWWPAFAGGAALGAAAVFNVGGGVPSLFADEKPAETKPADEKKYKPEDVHVGAPPELETLRKAVENAGKKGENVDDIRKHLDALEKALTGRAWVKPTPPVEIVRPGQPPRVANPGGRIAQVFPQFPVVPNLGGELDAEAMRKAQEMLRKAQENFRANPQDADAMRKLMDEHQRLVREAMGGLGGRIAAVPGIPGVPGIAVGGAGDLFGRRAGGEGRLGVRLERVPLVVADQLELPAGRGLVVGEVVPGSAAEKAGVKASDILIEFDGQAITDDAVDLVKRVQEAKAGEKHDLTVLRKGKKETLKVELPEAIRRDGRRVEGDVPVPGARTNSVRISLNNGQFDVQAIENDTSYGVKGEMAEGKPSVSEITVTEGEKTTTYDAVDKVPAEHREKVEGLLGKVGGGRQRKVD